MVFDDDMSYTSCSDDGDVGFAVDWGARVLSCVQQLVSFAWTLPRAEFAEQTQSRNTKFAKVEYIMGRQNFLDQMGFPEALHSSPFEALHFQLRTHGEP